MKLSVVIVNYNVRYFLEQCLYSVMKAAAGIDCEVFVVDNNSVDGSCGMLREKFPSVHLIENRKNTGFSFANNQAIRQSEGDYILLLNPDTVVQEDSFVKIISFMESHPDAGGLGVKMIDGKGNFLPESKRGLPTPEVAFYKIFGLSKLFPGSRIFGRYHLGFLNRDAIHQVDVLSGAFMLLRKSVLDKIGLLDETFFMYGEDIDLSYRISKAGFKNYYFPETTIIHYKGESTKKSSINYVMMFYNAMIIFARKHFSKQNAKLLALLINLAIYFTAGMALLSRFAKSISLPLADAAVIFLGYYFIEPYWEAYKFSGSGTYPPEYLKFIVPGYIFIWLTSMFFAGVYDKPVKILKMIKGILLGTLIILVVYSLLSENLRFSRALILMGSLWALFSTLVIRFILHTVKWRGFQLGISKKKRVVIVGFEEEAARISYLLGKTSETPFVAGFVCPVEEDGNNKYIGNIRQLQDIIWINNIEEIVFCAKDIPAAKIIKNMLDLSTESVEYKIASPDSVSVIGSNSIHTAGDLYTIHLNMISNVSSRRNKRLLDFILSLVFIVLSPFLLCVLKNKKGLYRNILSVLSGYKSWVGYYQVNATNTFDLPRIRRSVLSPLDLKPQKGIPSVEPEKINMDYAKDYHIYNDILIILKGLRNLGRN